MADIDIERKSSTGWIWALLGLVVVGVALFWLLRGSDGVQVAMVDEPAMESVPAAPTTDAPPTSALPAALQQYEERCTASQPEAMGLDHRYTAECLRLLAGAVEGTVSADRLPAVQPHLQSAREAAGRLASSDSEATTHSQTVRDSFDSLASALEDLQRQWHADLESQVQQLNQTVEAVDPAQPLLSQRESVQRFFQQAGTLLNRMRTTA